MPGLDGTGILFQPLIEQLRDIFHITVITYPTDRPSSLLDMVAMLKEKLITPEDTILLAESPRPFLLKFITMMPVKILFFSSWIPGILSRVFCLGLSANSCQVRKLKGALNKVSMHVLVHRLGLIARASFSQRSKIWSIPCGYLQASQDKLVPEQCAVWFAHHFKSFNLKKVDGPHFLLQANVQQCVKSILEFDQYFQAEKEGFHHG